MFDRVIQSVAAFDGKAPVQSATLADKLSGERHRWFVGRERELEAFDAALADPSCSLLFVHGATGVGKSSLLLEVERRCHEKGLSVALIDANEVGADEAQLAHLRQIGTLFDDRSGRARASRPVLLVDSFECLGAYEQALIDQLGHCLPSDALLLFASRKRPPHRLLIDPAWSRLARFYELLPWSEREAASFLDAQGVDSEGLAAIYRIAGGYPLALSVAVQIFRASERKSFGLDDIRELQAALGQMLPIQVSSRTQQIALDVCVLVRHTSVELLDHVLRSSAELNLDTAQDAFEWLANQPFIERRNQFLQPHAIARLALLTRVRREQKYQAIFRPVREFFVQELASGTRANADFDELFFIDRDIEVLREQEVVGIGGPSLLPAVESDHSAILELVLRHEGPESVEFCRGWLAADPAGFEVARSNGVQGFLQVVRIASARDIQLADRDPAAQLALRFVEEHPLEPDAVCIFFRWFMDRGDYQSPTAPVLGVVARQTQVIIASPGVQYSLCVFREPDDWRRMWDSAHSPHELVGKFESDGQQYSLIAFSFVEQSLRERVLAAYEVAPPAPPSSRKLPVLTPLTESDHARARLESRSTLEDRIAELANKTRLSSRETEVLRLLALGKSFDDIALTLHITARTVRFHQGNLFRKVGAASRIDLFRQLI